MNVYRYLPFTLTLDSPAIITAMGGDSNSSSSLPFIPGSAIRGAMARVLGDPGLDALKQQEFRDLVLGDKVNFLHAYPVHGGRRSLPVPVSLLRKKNEQESTQSIMVKDTAFYEGHPRPDLEWAESWPEEQLTAMTEGFLTIGEARPTLVHPSISARIHHQRDRKKGRAWKDTQGNSHGAIFTFESLDAGQSFQGMIQVCGDSGMECEKIENRIKGLLGNSILVGRSRRAGYGGMAQIEWQNIRLREVEGAGTHGLRPLSQDITPGDQFRLLLNSACIVRNPATGQIDPGALPDLVGQLVGNRAILVRKRWTFEIIGGFNRKWRLELPQVMAVSAGSIFVFEAKHNIPVADLYRIEDGGLGERKEEGYGRFVFLDAPQCNLSLHKPGKLSLDEAKEGQPPQLVCDIEARILDAKIARKIEETAAGFARSATGLPTNSLLGRLRTPLRGNPDEAIDTLRRWLKNDREEETLRRQAMDQLERCRIGMGKDKSSLSRWVVEATNQENVLKWLRADVIAQRYHIVSEESAMQLLKEKSKKLSVWLIDAVLAAITILNKTKEVNDGQ